MGLGLAKVFMYDRETDETHSAEHSQSRLKETQDRLLVWLMVVFPYKAPNLHLQLVQQPQQPRVHDLPRMYNQGMVGTCGKVRVA